LADRWKIAANAGYWLATAAWTAILGWHLGALLALHSPECDRVPLILLIAGPPFYALMQSLATGRPRGAFLRVALLTATFLGPLVLEAGSRLEAVPWWLVAVYAVGCGIAGMAVFLLAMLVRRGRGRPAPAHPLPENGRFVLMSLAGGAALVVISRLFLWHARVAQPLFEPIDYPNAYSRAMDWWTYGFLALVALFSLILVGLALRIHSPGNINEA
jgi:hypothetical protein